MKGLEKKSEMSILPLNSQTYAQVVDKFVNKLLVIFFATKLYVYKGSFDKKSA
jgi:hypothetical protein